MKQSILTLFTRTPLHIGAGTSVGAVDQPVMRERHTKFPVIPGSSIKGVLSDLFNDPANLGQRTEEAIYLFGAEDAKNARAGKLLVGEAKLLAFPIRSAKGCFAWLTCPLALSRLLRDGPEFKVALSGLRLNTEEVMLTEATDLLFQDKAVFEEYPLTVNPTRIEQAIVSVLQSLCGDAVWTEMPKKLALVSDEIFSYFAENACEVAQHIRIDDTTGVVAKGALFNQENVPSEALFYAVIQAKEEIAIEKLSAKLTVQRNLIQIGADATTGLGWCSVKMS